MHNTIETVPLITQGYYSKKQIVNLEGKNNKYDVEYNCWPKY